MAVESERLWNFVVARRRTARGRDEALGKHHREGRWRWRWLWLVVAITTPFEPGPDFPLLLRCWNGLAVWGERGGGGAAVEGPARGGGGEAGAAEGRGGRGGD